MDFGFRLPALLERSRWRAGIVESIGHKAWSFSRQLAEITIHSAVKSEG